MKRRANTRSALVAGMHGERELSHHREQPLDVEGLLHDLDYIDSARRLKGGNYYHRDGCETGNLVLFEAKLPAVHHRHLQVENYDIGKGLAVKMFQSLFAVGR